MKEMAIEENRSLVSFFRSDFEYYRGLMVDIELQSQSDQYEWIAS